MMTDRVFWVALVAISAAGGCHLVAPYDADRVPPSTSRRDEPAPDASSSAPADSYVDQQPDGARDDTGVNRADSATAPVACSVEGVRTACDPLTNGGCAAGSCYLLGGGVGTACVCPAGTLLRRDACETTRHCAPTFVCWSPNGWSAGSCVRLCQDNDWSSCASNEWCEPLSNLAPFGICQR